jgi:PII-like signaling protein
MKGFQITIMTEQNRRIGNQQPMEWLMHLAGELGISGATVFSGVESYGGDGRRHSARFFELTDQPVEFVVAVTADQADRFIERINQADTRVFFIKTEIEFGQLGAAASTA